MSRTSNASSPAPLVILWFRNDLRLGDNPALLAAVKTGAPIIPLYIWAPDEESDWPPGGASKWWLHQSLVSLQSSLRRVDSMLVLRRGHSLEALQQLAAETGATTVLWNRRYEPVIRERDIELTKRLQASGLVIETFNGSLLHEPDTIGNSSGRPFQVFTPFWKHCLGLPVPAEPLAPPIRLIRPGSWPGSASLEDFLLQPVPDWAGGLRACWRPGEAGASQQLDRFLAQAFDAYETGRNRPDRLGTSRLSPHLHFGEISPRQVWHRLSRYCQRLPQLGVSSRPRSQKSGASSPMAEWRQSQFVAELGWREFSHHLLFHFPNTPAHPLRAEFTRFRWRHDPKGLRAWQRGQTGYPLVDAGMRELWSTGWMHNRVRMVVASFLVKDLLISWTEGARWFWDTLVDADLAQNTLGWQWSAGCGADAAPFFRIFNPTMQGEKFDPLGVYVRRWVPELATLPDRWIHRPHQAPAKVLAEAGIRLGEAYPEPVVNHALAREVAIEAYGRMKAGP